MDSTLTIENIQKAFQWTVEKLRLDPVLLAVRLIGRKNFHGWQNPFMNELGSEFQVKKINDVMNGNLIGNPVYKEFSTDGQCVVGDIALAYNGSFGYVDNPISVNTTNSGDSFAILENTIECITSDDCLMFINCHVYPYLVRHISDSNPFVNKHVYDINDMIELHGINNLEVDQTLMMPVLLVAKSFYEDDAMNISASQNLVHIATKLINMYNDNMQSLGLEGDGGDVGKVVGFNLDNSSSNIGII
jgi:hypothetical protein